MAEGRVSEAAVGQLSEEQRPVFTELRGLVDEKYPEHPFCTDRCLLRYLR
jgi:hypothetical protein